MIASTQLENVLIHLTIKGPVKNESFHECIKLTFLSVYACGQGVNENNS